MDSSSSYIFALWVFSLVTCPVVFGKISIFNIFMHLQKVLYVLIYLIDMIDDNIIENVSLKRYPSY